MSADMSYPDLNPHGVQPSAAQPNTQSASQSAGQSVQNARAAVVNNASSAMNAVANHPITQSVTQGPMAESARDQVNKTSNEFNNVANSRKVPDARTATDQPLTQYHSLFYNILSWENPRISAIVYVAIVSALFFTRYVPVLSLALKGTYVILGIIAATEVVGRLMFDRGLATQMRPRKYYVVPRENLERASEDVEQLINFFVIEAQRIVFAENIYATIAAFTAALSLFVLNKFTPAWGMGLIAATVVFFTPLIYTTNKELIDNQLANASNVVNDQATHIRDMTAQSTSRATEVAKSTMNQYSAKAQELMGQAKAKASSPTAPNPANVNPMKNEPQRDLDSTKFPEAPRTTPLSQDIAQGLRDEPVRDAPILA